MIRLAETAKREINAWFDAAVRSAPGVVGLRLRSWLYSRRLPGGPTGLYIGAGVVFNGWSNIQIGDHVLFHSCCTLEARTGVVIIGARCGFNHGVWIGADGGRIALGTDVNVGPYVVFRAANHRFDRIPFQEQGHEAGEITVGNNVWIGAHVSVLSGARIGDNCVIGAGAVVRGEIPAGTLAAGVPATVVRNLSLVE